MKTITISDEDYEVLEKLSKAARISIGQYLDDFCFKEARQYFVHDIPGFISEFFLDGSYTYPTLAAAQAMADFANKDERFNETYYVEELHGKDAGKGFVVIGVPRDCPPR